MVNIMRSPERYRGVYNGHRNIDEDAGLRYLSPGAFTILSPEENGIPPDPPRAPAPYRFAPKVKRNRNQAFSIIAEPIPSRPGSRSPSPNGRVSPFRGRGFNPKGSRFDIPPELITGPPPEDIRTSPLIFGERVTHGPAKYRRKSQSKSLTNLSKTQQSPGRYGRPYSRDSRLSPITGSSPDTHPSSKIPRSRSTPPSKGKATPSASKTPSKTTSKTPSRTGSKTGEKPGSKPTKTPVKPVSKTPGKTSARPGSKPVSKPGTKPSTKPSSITAKPATAKGKKGEVKDKDKEKPKPVDDKEKPPPPIEVKVEEKKPEPDKISEESVEETTSSSSPEKKEQPKKANKLKGVRTKVAMYSAFTNIGKTPLNQLQGSAKKESHKTSNTSLATSILSASKQQREGSAASSTTTTSTKPESSAKGKKKFIKLVDLLPDNNSVVSTTTSTVGTPLKIEFEKIESDEGAEKEKTKPYGGELTSTSISSAINKMNDTVLDSKTVMATTTTIPSSSASIKDDVSRVTDAIIEEDDKSHSSATSKKSAVHKTPSEVLASRKSYFSTKVKVFASFLGTGERNKPMSRLTSASSIRSLVRGPSASTRRKPSASSNRGGTDEAGKDAADAATPQEVVEGAVAKVLSTISDDDNESKLSVDLKKSSATPAKTLGLKGGASPIISHVSKTSPGKGVASPLPAVDTSVNNNRDSAKKKVEPEDVKPLKITVQEKGNDGEVQSGNTFRIPISSSNGVSAVATGPGFFHRVGKSFLRSFKKTRAELPTKTNDASQDLRVPHGENDQNQDKKKSNLCSRLMSRVKGKSKKTSSAKRLLDEKKPSKFTCCGKKDGSQPAPGCFACCRKRKSSEEQPSGCFSCCGRKKRKVEGQELKKKEEDDSRQGCFSCCRRKKESHPKVSMTKVDEKKGCWERMKCCRTNKIGDKNKGKDRDKSKDSWADRRESILSQAPKRKRTCKGVLKSIFCCCCFKDKVGDDPLSRRISTNKSLTPLEIQEDLRPKLDISLVEHTSTMKGAIPVMPLYLAWFCCMLNVFLPGTGTAISGMFCLCIGKARFSQRDGAKQRIGSFIINLIIGFGQAFTVLFCLVGWGWSIWWGVIMIKMAKRQRKLKRIEDAEKAEEARQNQLAEGNNKKGKEVGKGHGR